ncbi:MAG TPA: protein kinase [Pyrinomonadaceae bacterium]|nr:protein kinase [Pyrinomonadaceae bacterium]
MNRTRSQQIEEVLQAALDLAPAQRAAFLDEKCGDAELRREVEQLLRRRENSEDFIKFPLSSGSLPADSIAGNKSDDSCDESNEEDAFIGKQVGAFRLIRELGRGGMGAVYLAERADGEFDQQVAVKFIKRGMDTDLILRRFRNERQILAALSHPNIARILNGGTTDDGLPYFVMEYVAGEPLYHFCDKRKLSITDRLKLFRQVCDAVNEAHRNLVVHRDLKPSNILVKPNGTPKLLDFGIAKILDPELADATIEPTATQMRLMTPEYASPEQVCGEPVAPTSDIYSLGVLLYELLTGHRPYRFKRRAIHEIARVVCEQTPEAPSESLTREDNLVPTKEDGKTTGEIVFNSRSANLETLRRQMMGDLDKIVLKALRKDPAERYQTAAELGDDIERFLEKLPVKAESFSAQIKPAHQTPEKNSIAILPFRNIGGTLATGETGEEFLGVGLADSIVLRLSNVRRLVVRPTSSVIRFENTGEDSFEIGRELGVEYVVSGNIRRAGKRIRVTAQLLNVADNSTRWAESFDEDFTDVLELEDSISEKVAKSLIPRLTGEERSRLEKRGTNDPQAYEAYLRGRYFWNQFTPESLPKAFASFQTAIDLDPNYALAYVGLTDFYIWANIYGMIGSAESIPKAEAAARRAIEIGNGLGEAYASLGLVQSNRLNWSEAEILYLRALELSPNYAHAHEWYSALLVGTGRYEQGVEEIKRAEQLDPLSLRTKTLTSWTLYQARHFEEALARAKQVIDLDKNYPQGYAQMSINLLMLGRTEEALANMRKFDEMIQGSAIAKYQLCFTLVAAGRREEAKAVLEEVKAQAAAGYVKPYFLAMACAALDERDLAIEYFEKSFDEDEPWLLWLPTEPLLDDLRTDPRFAPLLRRTNNPFAISQAEKIENRA